MREVTPLRAMVLAVLVALAGSVALAAAPSVAEVQSAIDEATALTDTFRERLSAGEGLDEDDAASIERYLDRAEADLRRAQRRLAAGRADVASHLTDNAAKHLADARKRFDGDGGKS